MVEGARGARWPLGQDTAAMGDLETAQELVAKTVGQRLGTVYDRGYSWAWSQFVPAVERVAAAKTRRERVLAAEGYWYIGDIHDLNCAPRAAVRAYRKAVQLDPKFAEAWRELGLRLGEMGDHKGEVRALRRALSLGHDDPESAALELKDAMENVENAPEPAYDNGGWFDAPAPTWDAWELLAERRADEALDLLKRKRSMQMRQLRAAAYGARGDTERQLEVWEAIGRGRGWVLLGLQDWFFLTKASWNSPRFWRALRAAGKRFCQILNKQHDGLFRAIPEPKGQSGTAAERRRYDRRRRLIVRYHIARTTRNANAARKLAEQYPKWTEVQRLAKRLCR